MPGLLDNRTMHWRVRLIDRKLKRMAWEVKRQFLHNNTELVDRFSMIVVGRNDNYGGDFTDRLKRTIDWNYTRLPNCELIYVEWNRIEDRPSDTEWIAQRYENSKCFIVPNAIHQIYNTNPKIPMMEYHAKNVAIREASNDWLALINADVFLGLNALRNLRSLNKRTVYGTHYNNIEWHGEEITEKHITDPKLQLNQFSAGKALRAVVGNFILSHKDNWMKAGGYNEKLTQVRIGVDRMGLYQLLHQGLDQMIIGDHYHLDHAESAIKGANTTHGDTSFVSNNSSIPYSNPPDWGMRAYQKQQIADNIWEFIP